MCPDNPRTLFRFPLLAALLVGFAALIVPNGASAGPLDDLKSEFGALDPAKAKQMLAECEKKEKQFRDSAPKLRDLHAKMGEAEQAKYKKLSSIIELNKSINALKDEFYRKKSKLKQQRRACDAKTGGNFDINIKECLDWKLYKQSIEPTTKRFVDMIDRLDALELEVRILGRQLTIYANRRTEIVRRLPIKDFIHFTPVTPAEKVNKWIADEKARCNRIRSWARLGRDIPGKQEVVTKGRDGKWVCGAGDRAQPIYIDIRDGKPTHSYSEQKGGTYTQYAVTQDKAGLSKGTYTRRSAKDVGKSHQGDWGLKIGPDGKPTLWRYDKTTNWAEVWDCRPATRKDLQKYADIRMNMKAGARKPEKSELSKKAEKAVSDCDLIEAERHVKDMIEQYGEDDPRVQENISRLNALMENEADVTSQLADAKRYHSEARMHDLRGNPPSYAANSYRVAASLLAEARDKSECYERRGSIGNVIGRIQEQIAALPKSSDAEAIADQKSTKKAQRQRGNRECTEKFKNSVMLRPDKSGDFFWCGCRKGYRWNTTKTACIKAKSKQQLAREGCRTKYKNSVFSGFKKGVPHCRCPKGRMWNRYRTACVRIPKGQTVQRQRQGLDPRTTKAMRDLGAAIGQAIRSRKPSRAKRYGSPAPTHAPPPSAVPAKPRKKATDDWQRKMFDIKPMSPKDREMYGGGAKPR